MDRIRSWVKILKRENGSGLVLTLMVLMVLSVLAASLATVTIGSYRLTAKNRSAVSAYYVAEASLNETYEEIKLLVNDTYQLDINQDTYFSMVETFINNTNGRKMTNFTKQFGENPTAQIQIKKISDGNPREYTLTSVGTIGNTTRTLTKNFSVGYKAKSSGGGLPSLIDGAAAIVKNRLDLLGGTVVGDLYIESTAPKSVNLSWGNFNQSSLMINSNADLNSMLTYPDNYQLSEKGPFPKVDSTKFNWELLEKLISNFPDFGNYSVPSDMTIYQDSSNPDGNRHKLIDKGSLYVNHWLLGNNAEKLTIDQNVSFKDIIFSSNYALNIDTKNKDIIILVDNLDITNGQLNIIGNGTITFQVKKKIILGAGSKVNINGATEQLKIYYSGTDPISLSGAQAINGSLFTEKSDLYFTGGAEFRGLLISGGKNITYDGGTYSNSHVFAPNADLKLTAGAKINGVLVGNTLNMSGGAQLLTSPLNDDFGFGIDDNENTAEEQNIDLITSEPPIETDSE